MPTLSLPTVALVRAGRSLRITGHDYSVYIQDAGPGFARSPYVIISDGRELADTTDANSAQSLITRALASDALASDALSSEASASDALASDALVSDSLAADALTSEALAGSLAGSLAADLQAADAFAASLFATPAAASARWISLALLASLDSTANPDETFSISEVAVTEADDRVTLVIDLGTTAWLTKSITLVCTPETIELSTTVAGIGALTDLTLGGGQAMLGNGASGVFRSGMFFDSVFVPAPTEPVQFVRPAHSSAVLGVVGDSDPGRLNAIFSPPPLALGFGKKGEPNNCELDHRAHEKLEQLEHSWLGVSVRDDVRRLTFTTLRYEPLDGGFLLRFSYEGKTVVDGEFTSPTLVFRPAASEWEVLDNYRDDLEQHGFAHRIESTTQAWWQEPMFCGWGAQVARAQTLSRESALPITAASLARQDIYDEFLALMASSGLRPGTIVVDDRWQAEYGAATVDTEHWPDLKKWIAERHAAGQKVLLWWKAWDAEGVPAEECVCDAGGNPLTVDPANPAYTQRLAHIVRGLVGPEGLDADGFKVDFTQRAPSGRSLQSHPGVWGIAALHALLETLYSAAKAAKADALVITHAIHPSFGAVSDMVRLNDVLERDIHGTPVAVAEQLKTRAAIARHTLPDHLIDTDQWPMPNRTEWLNYVEAQSHLGVPALYYLETVDNSGELIDKADLATVAATWARYRNALGRAKDPRAEEHRADR